MVGLGGAGSCGWGARALGLGLRHVSAVRVRCGVRHVRTVMDGDGVGMGCNELELGTALCEQRAGVTGSVRCWHPFKPSPV